MIKLLAVNWFAAVLLDAHLPTHWGPLALFRPVAGILVLCRAYWLHLKPHRCCFCKTTHPPCGPSTYIFNASRSQSTMWTLCIWTPWKAATMLLMAAIWHVEPQQGRLLSKIWMCYKLAIRGGGCVEPGGCLSANRLSRLSRGSSARQWCWRCLFAVMQYCYSLDRQGSTHTGLLGPFSKGRI